MRAQASPRVSDLLSRRARRRGLLAVRACRFAGYAVLLAFVTRAFAAESIVLAWNTAMLDAVRADTTPPPIVARNLAMVHLALDAVCREDSGRIEAMLAISGCRVASALYPTRRASFERLCSECLAARGLTPTALEQSRAALCAQRILDERRDDGASGIVTYIPHAEPGNWRRTAPFYRPPELPQWVGVRAFAVADFSRVAPRGPPALDSAAWAQALDEMRRIGGRESTERTEAQRASAVFWSDFSYTCTPPGHWNEIAASVVSAQKMNERQAARLFAVMNVAMADAGVACWQAKFRYNFWRPITVLQSEGWTPLLNTPAHPEYPSGHSTFSGAAATVLVALLGTDECEFTVRSDAAPGPPRMYHGFWAAAREISLSRVFGGIHYRFSGDDGLELGRRVADEVLRWDRERGSRGGVEAAK